MMRYLMPSRRQASSSALDWALMRYITAQVPGLTFSAAGQFQHLPAHKIGLFVLGVSLVHHHVGAGGVVGLQFLGHPHSVVGDERAGGIQYFPAGPVVLFQRYHPGVRVIFLEAQDVPNVGVSP